MLRLLHPIMPFITEEIWQRVSKLTSGNNDTLLLSSFPRASAEWVNTTVEEEMEWVKAFIQAVRTIRSEMSISPAKRIPLLLRHITPNVQARLEKYTPTLVALSKLTSIQCLEENEEVPVSASAVVGELELLIPMHDLIDKEAELSRLKKELLKLEQEIARAEGKLNNPAFTDKAPLDVVQKEQEKLQQAKLVRDKHLHHQAKIEAL